MLLIPSAIGRRRRDTDHFAICKLPVRVLHGRSSKGHGARRIPRGGPCYGLGGSSACIPPGEQYPPREHALGARLQRRVEPCCYVLNRLQLRVLAEELTLVRLQEDSALSRLKKRACNLIAPEQLERKARPATGDIKHAMPMLKSLHPEGFD